MPKSSHTAWRLFSLGICTPGLVPNAFCLTIGEARASSLVPWRSCGETEREILLRCSWTPKNYVEPSAWVCPKGTVYCCLTGCSYREALLWKTDLSLCRKFVLLDPKTTEIKSVLKSISTDFHGLEIRFLCLFNSESQQFLTASLWIFFPYCRIKRCYLTWQNLNNWALCMENTALLSAPFHRQGTCIWNHTSKLQQSREQIQLLFCRYLSVRKFFSFILICKYFQTSSLM